MAVMVRQWRLRWHGRVMKKDETVGIRKVLDVVRRRCARKRSTTCRMETANRT